MWTATPQTRQKEGQWTPNHFVPCVDMQSISIKQPVATSYVLSLATDVGESSQISSTTCSTLSKPVATVCSTQPQHKQETTASVTHTVIREPFFATSVSNRVGDQPCDQALTQAMFLSKSGMLAPTVSPTR